jgi:hypothetical protein
MIGDYPLDFPQGGVQTHFFHLSSHLSSNPDVEVNIITFGENDRCIRALLKAFCRSRALPEGKGL